MTKYLKTSSEFRLQAAKDRVNAELPTGNQPAVIGLVFAGILLTFQALVQANWPGFRGSTGLGYTTQENLPITWGGPANENVLWISHRVQKLIGA
jgi:hypothetical protein